MSLSIPSIQLPSALENAYFAIVLEKGKPRATEQCNHLFDVQGNLWAKYDRLSCKAAQFSRYLTDNGPDYQNIQMALYFTEKASQSLLLMD
jgi:hypothetical protein